VIKISASFSKSLSAFLLAETDCCAYILMATAFPSNTPVVQCEHSQLKKINKPQQHPVCKFDINRSNTNFTVTNLQKRLSRCQIYRKGGIVVVMVAAVMVVAMVMVVAATAAVMVVAVAHLRRHDWTNRRQYTPLVEAGVPVFQSLFV
jgi:hypothetical protein